MPTNAPQLQKQRKEALLKTALKEFAEAGYEQASTNRIARDAGISKPLMFHYVGNKQQLFLFVYEYFSDLLNKEYYRQLDRTEPDLIKRLHSAYLIQLRLLYAYPWVFDFFKMSAGMDIQLFDEDIQQKLIKQKTEDCPDLFEQYDRSLFLLPQEDAACIQILYCSCKGFQDLMLDKIRTMQPAKLCISSLEKDLDIFFMGLRRLMYKDNGIEALHADDE